LAALASPAAAQAGNTGQPGWQVDVYTVSSGTWSGAYNVFAPGSSEPGEWQDNTGSTQWISAWDDYITSPGAGDYVHTTDANARYHYIFRYTFDGALSGGSLAFNAGWDNIFKGMQFSNSGIMLPSDYVTGPLPERSVDDYFGFCRNGDAMHDSGDIDCSARFVVPVSAGAAWMQFEIWGDGQTDGMWLEWDQASIPAETVPEPATMTLLATGLAGIAGKSFRRRRAVKS
jgi:hypothetical protein